MSASAIAYWASAVSQPIDPLEIPCDRLRLNSSGQRTTGNVEVSFNHANVLVDQIAAQCQVLPEVVCTAAYSILLHRYTQKSQLRIGYVPDNSETRTGTDPDIRTCFPVTASIRSEYSAKDHMQQLSKAFSIGEINTLKDFKTIERELNPAIVTDISSSIETVLAFGHQPEYHDRSDGPELFLFITRQHEAATLNARYVQELFSQETIIRLISHLEQLLDGIASNPDTRISQLSMLKAEERTYLLTGLNDSARTYPSESTMMDLFMQQALQSPDAIAVRGPDDKTLTYRELDESSNRLARYLDRSGVQSTDRIGVYLERGNTMMIALFGVMKSGASYVPMDPVFPSDRLSFMVQDSSLKYVLTQSSLAESAPCSQTQALLLDNLSGLLQDHGSDSIQLATANSEAYVIYTSGSTGVPKGVMIAHQALTNFLVSILDAPGVEADDRMLAVTTLSFDISAIELFAPLLVGAQVILASREQAMSPHLLSKRIDELEANFISATPSTWKMLLDHGWSGSSQMKSLCGGEALTRDLADRLIVSCKELWNMYGPTETTVYSSTERIQPGRGVITVGGPIANTSLYVLDKSMNLLPLGVPGELYIGGDGVAIGYLNQDELTAERFVADPFGAIGARMYKTGDSARWLANGRLEVLGRLDDQVKLRGYRIEPGEIRARLIEASAVSDAVVMVRQDGPGQARLVAYLVAKPGADVPESGQLHSMLTKTLPEYMVPDVWMVLDELPQTPNGKVDRKQLPPPDAGSLLPSEKPVAPRSDAEKQIALIWKEVLQLEEVGVHSSFFELGGQSVQAANLVGQLQDRLELSIPLLEIFQGATISTLARHFEGTDADQPTQKACRLITSPADNQPVFMVGSNPLFRLACLRLDGKHPVYQVDSYALQIQRQVAGKRLLKSIEELATALLYEIKKIQPQGPYLIGGGCEGALIAFEIAVQLQQQGDEVEKLMSWHTPAPGPDLKSEFGGPALRGFRWLRWRVKSVLLGGSMKNLGLNGFVALLKHELVEYTLFSAMYSYGSNNKFDGDMHIVVLTQMEAENNFSERSMGWKNYVTGHTRLFELGGTHDTWLQDSGEGFGEFLFETLVTG